MTVRWIPLATLTSALIGACGQAPPSVDPAGEVADATVNAEMMGQRLYEDLCASCHGVDARGDGPLSQLLKIETPDLTRIAAGHGGSFPRETVRATIDGTEDVQAHGTRIMPVWGRTLRPSPSSEARSDREAAARQIDYLVAYLSSIQGNPSH